MRTLLYTHARIMRTHFRGITPTSIRNNSSVFMPIHADKKKLPAIKMPSSRNQSGRVFSRLSPQGHKADYKFINLSLFIFTSVPPPLIIFLSWLLSCSACSACNVFYFLFFFREVSPVLRRTCLLILINKCW
jgi:hypothetical protein